MSLTDDIQSRTALLLGEEAMNHLRAARVIVFGVGGVGSWCVEALARAGVGKITVVDSDSVAPSNINRQLVASVPTLGIPKVTVMARRILDVNPDCRVSTAASAYNEHTAPSFRLNEYDLVVDAIDSLAPKALLINSATRTPGVQLVSSMGAALKTDVFDIAEAEFRNVTGCPLARALRDRFRKSGVYPARKFRCVYSPLRSRQGMGGESLTPNGPKRVNGTIVTTTAAFGLALAQLAVESIIRHKNLTEFQPHN